MESAETSGSKAPKSGLLYPMLVIAALAVTVFSLVGIATMLGWMPSALSGNDMPPRTAAAPPADVAPGRAQSSVGVTE